MQPGFLMPVMKKINVNALTERRCEMKFLLIILAIRFVAGLLNRGKNENQVREETTVNRTVLHPSEYELR